MNLKTKPTILRKRIWLAGTLFAGLLFAHCSLEGQDALMPRPEFSIAPPALRELQADDLQVITPPDVQRPLLQAGPIGVRPHIFYRFLAGDGIPAATNHVSSIVQEISPGILFALGSHWSLDYTPSWRFYSSSAFRDTLNHAVRLSGGTTYENWTLMLAQSYLSTSEPLVETGTQTDQESFVTDLGASYRFNSRMSVDLSLNQNIVSTEEFSSYNEWRTLDWFNYRFWEKVDTGIGLGFGYVDVESGSDMTYQQILARVGWKLTGRVNVDAHGGVEFRQFLDDNDSLINPVVGARAEYRPFEFTVLSLSIDHTVDASYFENQVTETTAIIGGLRQRLLEVLLLELSGGYNRAEYIASDATPTGRTDEYYSFNARLSTSLLKKRATVGVFYQYSDNSSSDSEFGFTGNQVGFDLGYRF